MSSNIWPLTKFLRFDIFMVDQKLRRKSVKVNIWLLGILLISVAGCNSYRGERMESGRVIDVVMEDTQIPQDDGSMLPDIVEVGKKILVGDAIFVVRYSSVNSLASALKVGDCVKVRVHVYSTELSYFTHKENFIPDKSREIAPCAN